MFGRAREIPNVATPGLRAAGALVVAAIVATPLAAQAQSGYYAGKTLRIIVGSSAGGGYDTYARAIAPYLAEHLPGKPRVVVQNMPGGGGLTSVLYLDANAPKDGTAITMFNAGVITDAASKPDQAKVDLTKMAWIGSATRSFRMCFVWHGAGIKNWKDLDRSRLVTFGATGVGSGSYNDAGILKNLLKQNVKAISGYPGRTEVHLAMERGEVDGECGTSEGMPANWFTEKKIDILLRMSETKSPDIPGDVPWVGEFVTSPEDMAALRLLIAANELGRPIVASRQVPAAQIEMLRAAFDATMKDENYLAFAAKRKLFTSAVSGKDAQDMIAQIFQAPRSVSERAKEVVK
jgi:tripartite-type tricarboxylate transporter receptor subunit TctC